MKPFFVVATMTLLLCAAMLTSVASPRVSIADHVADVLDTSCSGPALGSVPEAPGTTSLLGIRGTTTADLNEFGRAYNDIRIENCLDPVPLKNFRYDGCLEARLYWMAEDPSTRAESAWGHAGVARSDQKPEVGCDGNLAGGDNENGATVAQAWWDSEPHRQSLYRPGHPVTGACIAFAIVRGGIPHAPSTFARASARWLPCS